MFAWSHLQSAPSLLSRHLIASWSLKPLLIQFQHKCSFRWFQVFLSWHLHSNAVGFLSFRQRSPVYPRYMSLCGFLKISASRAVATHSFSAKPASISLSDEKAWSSFSQPRSPAIVNQNFLLFLKRQCTSKNGTGSTVGSVSYRPVFLTKEDSSIGLPGQQTEAQIDCQSGQGFNGLHATCRWI